MLSLEVRSNDCFLADLTAAIGAAPAATSRSIGETRFRESVWPISYWIYEIGAFEECDIGHGWKSVSQACARFSDGFKNALNLSRNNRVVLNIGIISSTLSISVIVPNFVIGAMAADGIVLEVATYLADE